MQWPSSPQPKRQDPPLQSQAGERVASFADAPGFPPRSPLGPQPQPPQQHQHLPPPQLQQQPLDFLGPAGAEQSMQMMDLPQLGRTTALARSSYQHAAERLFAADLAGRPDLRTSVCSSVGSYPSLADMQSQLSQALQQQQRASSLMGMPADNVPAFRSPGSLPIHLELSGDPVFKAQSHALEQHALASALGAASQPDPLSQRSGSAQQSASSALLAKRCQVPSLRQHQASDLEGPVNRSDAWPANLPQGTLMAPQQQQQQQQARLQLHHAQPAHRIQLVEAPAPQPSGNAVPLQHPRQRQRLQLHSQWQREEVVRSGRLPDWNQREGLSGHPDAGGHVHSLDAAWPFDPGSVLPAAGRAPTEPGSPGISSSEHAGSQKHAQATQSLQKRPDSSTDPDPASQAEASQAGPRLRRGPKRKARAAMLSLADLDEDMDEPTSPAAGRRRGRRRASSVGGLAAPEDQLASMGSKKANRVLANRQSAARSKERKEQYTVMLEGQVALLQAELANERAQMKQLQEDMETLEAANHKLRQQLGQPRLQRQLYSAQPATQQARWEVTEPRPLTTPPLPFMQDLSALQVPLYPSTGTQTQSDPAGGDSKGTDLVRSGHAYPPRSEAPELTALPGFSMPEPRGSDGNTDAQVAWQQLQQLDEPLLQARGEPGFYMRPQRQGQGTQALPTSTADALTSLHDFL